MWTSHYMAAGFRRDETLEEAITQRDAAICGSLTDELTTLRSTNDSLLRALDMMRNEFTRAREELEASHRSFRAAMANVERLYSAKGEITNQANATIRELCDKIDTLTGQLRNLESGHTPRRRKFPRRHSRSPSASDSRHASSYLSRPNSLHWHNEHDNLDRGADKTINELPDEVDSLRSQLRDVGRGYTPRRRKLPRRGSHTPSPSRSHHALSRASHSASPMVEDWDDVPTRPTATPLHLLSPLTMLSATTSSTSSRQVDITYVKGETNLVADALSRYDENNHWDRSHDTSQSVTTDARLDPEGENLPWNRFEETRTMHEPGDDSRTRPQRQRRAPRRADEPVSFAPKRPVVEAVEARRQDAAELPAHEESGQEVRVSTWNAKTS